MSEVFFERLPAGLSLRVRLTPKASVDRIDGIGAAPDGRAVLLARVRALPEDGAANVALVALLAKSLKLPKSSLSIASGGKGRVKTVLASGDAAEITDAVARLESLLAGGQ